MILQFSKMHGLGNDFMVIDGVRQRVRLSPAQIRQLGDRHTGIGFDQLLLVEAPALPDTDFRYRIFNSDGGEVEQCGNGARLSVSPCSTTKRAKQRAPLPHCSTSPPSLLKIR